MKMSYFCSDDRDINIDDDDEASFFIRVKASSELSRSSSSFASVLYKFYIKGKYSPSPSFENNIIPLNKA